MQSKISLKGSSLIVSIIGIAFSSVMIFFPALDLPNIASPEQTNAGMPTHLEIPVINVSAPIQSVGLTPDGAMDAPKGPDNVAWFNLGPHPGNQGSAVLAGHYGRWKNGKGSVFDDLNKLKKGDLIYVKDEKGETITFVVREIRSYDPKADASDVFESTDGKSHLNLVTCEGAWNKTLKSYPMRMVVFTDKEKAH